MKILLVQQNKPIADGTFRNWNEIDVMKKLVSAAIRATRQIPSYVFLAKVSLISCFGAARKIEPNVIRKWKRKVRMYRNYKFYTGNARFVNIVGSSYLANQWTFQIVQMLG